MSIQDFINILSEEIEIESVDLSLSTDLSSIEEWDSMAIMILIALVDDNFKMKITNDDIKKSSNILHIVELIGKDKFD